MEFEASAARFQEMDKQACTSPQSLCDECRTLFTRLSDSGKFKVSDILYTAETWPMIFYHEANDITNNNTDMVVRDMECWLAAWYGHPVKVFGVSIPFRLSQHRMTPKPAHPVPGSTTFYLVDFPAHIDPEVMLEQGLLSSADVPIDNWEIAVPGGGDCLSAERMEILCISVYKDQREQRDRAATWSRYQCLLM